MITELTSQQQALVLNYWRKWKSVTFSTDELDYEYVKKLIKSVYRLMELKEPDLLFFKSPLQMLQQMGDPPSPSPCNLFSVVGNIHEQLKSQLSPPLWTQLWRRQSYALGTKLSFSIGIPLITGLEAQLGYSLSPQTKDQIMAITGVAGEVAMLDFLISTLGCTHDSSQQWQALLTLIEHCPWHFAFEDVCLVCDRPTEVLLDSDSQLKIGEEPAIQFADGWSIKGRIYLRGGATRSAE